MDGVSATVNGNSAYVFYNSPALLVVLTPPATMSGPVNVVVTNNGASSASFTAQAATISPSLFVFHGGSYVVSSPLPGAAAALGPLTLFPGSTMAVKPGELVALYGNGFGPASTSPTPAIAIGGIAATVQFAGLVLPGGYEFNVVVPSGLADGDQPITATYGGVSTQPGALITIQN